MASAKKKPTKKDSNLAVRPVSEGDSPKQPGYPLPAPAPSYRSLNSRQQAGLEQSMRIAGQRAYKHPITMADAVQSRVTQIENAIKRAPGGVPDPEWYDKHTEKVLKHAATHGAAPGTAIDTSATLSSRNRPSNELVALSSALHIGQSPHRQVTVSRAMAPHVGTSKIMSSNSEEDESKKSNKLVLTSNRLPGSYKLGDLGPDEVASLAGAAKKAKEEIPESISNVSNRSAGREVAKRAITVARGKTFDEVAGSSPKVRNYARAMHLSNPQFSAYDREVLARRAAAQANPEMGIQGTLFKASDLLSQPAPSETVEDYIGHALTSMEAAEKGKTGKPAREAQNIIKPPKVGKSSSGKRTQLIPKNWSADEAAHAFNEEATRRAAETIGYESFGPDGESFREHITPKGAQVIQWVETQRHVLNEDPEYNAQQKAAAKAQKTEERKKKAAQKAQGVLDLKF